MTFDSPPIIGITTVPATDKVRLLAPLLKILAKSGIRIGIIKATRDRRELAHIGKDSHSLRESGANPIVIGSSHRWARILKKSQHKTPKLPELIDELQRDSLDIVFVDGFFGSNIPRILLLQSKTDLTPDLKAQKFLAAVHNGPMQLQCSYPCLSSTTPKETVDFFSWLLNKDQRTNSSSVSNA